MHKRTLLVVAPLCVVALAAGVAFAAPMAAEPDNPHAVRPIAASPNDTTAYPLRSLGVVAAFGEYLRDLERQQLEAFLRDIQLHEFAALLDSIAAEQAAAAAAARPRPAVTATGAVGNGGFLECVKQRESKGDYTVHNYQGSGASGAYQFLPGTWNSIASSSGRSDLVGIDPAAASPADQDAMAAALYAQQGAAPWGGGC